jgi:hypothetical protein
MSVCIGFLMTHRHEPLLELLIGHTTTLAPVYLFIFIYISIYRRDCRWYLDVDSSPANLTLRGVDRMGDRSLPRY